MKRFIPLVLLVLLVSAGPALAGDFPAPYVELKAGGDYTQISDIKGSDALTGFHVFNHDADGWTGVVGGAAGLNFKSLGLPVRAEVEYAYHSELSSDAAPFITATWPVSAKSHVSSQTLFLNLYYDIDTGTAFTPYVGGGVGEAWNHTRTSIIDANGTRESDFHNTTENFAWNLGAGCAYDLTRNWKISAGYRYVNMGEMKGGGDIPNFGCAKLKSTDVTAQELTLGVRYQF